MLCLLFPLQMYAAKNLLAEGWDANPLRGCCSWLRTTSEHLRSCLPWPHNRSEDAGLRPWWPELPATSAQPCFAWRKGWWPVQTRGRACQWLVGPCWTVTRTNGWDGSTLTTWRRNMEEPKNQGSANQQLCGSCNSDLPVAPVSLESTVDFHSMRHSGEVTSRHGPHRWLLWSHSWYKKHEQMVEMVELVFFRNKSK